jgi:hypothetical protein
MSTFAATTPITLEQYLAFEAPAGYFASKEGRSLAHGRFRR